MRLIKDKRDNTVSTHLLSMRDMKRDMNHITTLNHIITPTTTHILTTMVVITTLVVLEAEDSEEVVTEVAALGVLTEEAMEEAAMAVAADTGKLKEKVSKEGPMCSFFFYPISTGILIFTNYYKGFNPTDIVRRLGDFFLVYSSQVFFIF